MNRQTKAAPTVPAPNDFYRDKRELYSYTAQDIPFRPSQQIGEPFYINDRISLQSSQPPPQPARPTYYPLPHANFDLTNLLSTSVLEPNHYIVNGRTVKPYEVMEQHNEGNDQSFFIKSNSILSSRQSLSNLQRFLKDSIAYTPQNTAPSFLPGQFDTFVTRFNRPAPIQLERNVPLNQVPVRPPRPIYNQKHRGPIALGSGSLGYIRLANGDIYIGSGSLGYTNEQQFEERRVPPLPVRYSLPTAVTFAPNNNY